MAANNNVQERDLEALVGNLNINPVRIVEIIKILERKRNEEQTFVPESERNETDNDYNNLDTLFSDVAGPAIGDNVTLNINLNDIPQYQTSRYLYSTANDHFRYLPAVVWNEEAFWFVVKVKRGRDVNEEIIKDVYLRFALNRNVTIMIKISLNSANRKGIYYMKNKRNEGEFIDINVKFYFGNFDKFLEEIRKILVAGPDEDEKFVPISETNEYNKLDKLFPAVAGPDRVQNVKYDINIKECQIYFQR